MALTFVLPMSIGDLFALYYSLVNAVEITIHRDAKRFTVFWIFRGLAAKIKRIQNFFYFCLAEYWGIPEFCRILADFYRNIVYMTDCNDSNLHMTILNPNPLQYFPS